jgi:poly-gamma-glutamate capsule biosynthesis protein CapA/YwtB (metallophosphatase superfamily)
VNLETALTASEDAWPGKGIHYRTGPENGRALAAAGIDCCALANNHVLDWGYAGLAETLRTLAALGIRHAGAGGSRAVHDADWLAATLNREGARFRTSVERTPDGGLALRWDSDPGGTAPA